MNARPATTPMRARSALLACGPVSNWLVESLAEHFDVETYEGGRDLPASLLDRIDVLVVRSPFRLSSDAVRTSTRLKLVIRAGSGMDGICQDTLSQRGIPLHRLNMSGVSVAEHAFALLLCAARQLPAMTASIAHRRWDKVRARGFELDGKTLHVIGFGDIGRHVARIAQGFRLNVLVTDPSPDKPEKRVVLKNLRSATLVPMMDGLAVADIVILCASLGERSRTMIDSKAMAAMKDGCILINVARADLVDQIALKDALDAGKFLALGLDAHYGEPELDWDFLRHPRIVATPHVGAQTMECRARIERRIVVLANDFAKGQT